MGEEGGGRRRGKREVIGERGGRGERGGGRVRRGKGGRQEREWESEPCLRGRQKKRKRGRMSVKGQKRHTRNLKLTMALHHGPLPHL